MQFFGGSSFWSQAAAAFPSPWEAFIAFNSGSLVFFTKSRPFFLFTSSLSSSYLLSLSSLSSSSSLHSVVIRNDFSPLLSLEGDYKVLESVVVVGPHCILPWLVGRFRRRTAPFLFVRDSSFRFHPECFLTVIVIQRQLWSFLLDHIKLRPDNLLPSSMAAALIVIFSFFFLSLIICSCSTFCACISSPAPSQWCLTTVSLLQFRCDNGVSYQQSYFDDKRGRIT